MLIKCLKVENVHVGASVVPVGTCLSTFFCALPISPSVGPSVRSAINFLDFLLLYCPCPTARNIAVVYMALLNGPSQESEKSGGF